MMPGTFFILVILGCLALAIVSLAIVTECAEDTMYLAYVLAWALFIVVLFTAWWKL